MSAFNLCVCFWCIFIVVCAGVLMIAKLPGCLAQCIREGLCRHEYTASRMYYRVWWNLTEVPRDIPEDAIFVQISSNKITHLPPGVFDHLKDCEDMRLNNNKIGSVPSGVFNSLSKCTFLSLALNLISSVDKDAFRGMDSLVFLWLLENRISQLEPGTFSSLKHLKQLRLDNNLISSLHQGVFLGLSNLTSLLLLRNHISILHPGIFDPLHSIQTIYLFRNRLTTLNPEIFLNLPRHPLSISMSHGENDRNQWVCTSLCWLKHEEQHGTIKWILDTSLPICADGREWSLLECGDKGLWTIYEKSLNELIRINSNDGKQQSRKTIFIFLHSTWYLMFICLCVENCSGNCNEYLLFGKFVFSASCSCSTRYLSWTWRCPILHQNQVQRTLQPWWSSDLHLLRRKERNHNLSERW